MHRRSRALLSFLRWRVALAGFSTWLDSPWRSHFRRLLLCAPQIGTGTPLPTHLTPPCPSLWPCPTDPPPPAAAPLPTAGPPQDAPPQSRKTATPPRWREDSRPKLLRRNRQAGARMADLPQAITREQREGGWVVGWGARGGNVNQRNWLPGSIYQTPPPHTHTLGPLRWNLWENIGLELKTTWRYGLHMENQSRVWVCLQWL